MAAANAGPEMPNQVTGWWAAFGGGIIAAFGGIVGLVSKVRSQDARMAGIDERQGRTERQFSDWLERVEGKIDRLTDHFAEKGIHWEDR